MRTPGFLDGRFIEREALAVRGPGRRTEAITLFGSHLAEPCPICPNHIDTELLGMLPAKGGIVPTPIGIAIGRKCQPLPIRRPRRPKKSIRLGWIPLNFRRSCEIAEPAGLDIKRPDIRLVSRARRYESDARTIRGKDPSIVHGRVVRQSLDSGTIRARAINIRLSKPVALRREDDPLSVG